MTVQVLAVLAALALGALLLRALLRRSITAAARSFQLCMVPFLGFVTYAVQPGPIYLELGLSILTAALVVWGLVLYFWSRGNRATRWTEPVKAASVERSARLQLALQATGVLAASSYLALFEPVFAVANLTANMLWALWWMRSSTRLLRSEGSIEIAASRSAVWAFVADPSQLGRWRGNASEVSVDPPGPLRVGSRISAIRSVPLAVPWEGKTELRMQTTTVVTELIVNSSFAVRQLDGPGTTMLSLADAEGGTRVTLASVYGWPPATAVLGEALRRGPTQATGDEVVRRDVLRLKELVEQPHSSAG